MTLVQIDLPDLAAMERFGARIAAQLCADDVVALSGELGAGKTTLARAILLALGHRGEVPSPSFAILEHYDVPGGSGGVRLSVVHADFYRIADRTELVELGLDELREGAVLLAEWPEHAGGFGDEPGCLSVALEAAENGRRAIVSPGADWLGRGPWT